MAKPSELTSKIMRSVRSKNTKPEIVVRKMIRNLGFYYRLHAKELPGKPDIVLRKSKKVVFVNGCFWHGHGCGKGRLPKSNVDFWSEKIERNCARDKTNLAELSKDGWQCLVVWQCEIKNTKPLMKTIKRFLTKRNPSL